MMYMGAVASGIFADEIFGCTLGLAGFSEPPLDDAHPRFSCRAN